MPILKIGPNGDVVEGHRDLGEDGVGKLAEYVQDGDVTMLSLKEDPQVLKDRKAMAILEANIKLNQKKKWAQNVMRATKLQALENKQAEQLFIKQKQQAYRDNLNSSISKLQQISQSGMMHENMSGVSGYGLTPDGRRPILSQAAVDFRPIEDVGYSFGGPAEEWGGTTSADMGTLGDGVSLSNYPTLLNISTLEIRTPDGVTNVPIKTADQAEIGSFDTKDDENIQKWNNGVYSFYYFLKNNTYAYSEIFNSLKKSELNSMMSTAITANTLQKYSAQGWSWSVYFENGEIYLVKVPFSYGLPIVDAYVDLSKLGGREKEYMVTGWIGLSNILSNTDLMYFKKLSPLIKSLARKYLVDTQSQGIEAVRETMQTTTQAPPQKKSFIQKVIAALTTFDSSNNYQHPMIKRGLIK